MYMLYKKLILFEGHPYDGEQVEAWALGVLLYILIYGENPFYDVADTVRAELHPPHHEVIYIIRTS